MSWNMYNTAAYLLRRVAYIYSRRTLKNKFVNCKALGNTVSLFFNLIFGRFSRNPRP